MSVYKIYDKNNEDQFYIGSTKDFSKRQIGHKVACKIRNCKLYNYINENGGWDNFKMEVLEYCLEYQEQEKELIKQLNPPLNTKLYKFDKKENDKKYREENRDKIKKYREENRDKMKIYREENKDKINEKITCKCGCIVSKPNIVRHRKTKRHLSLMESKD